MQDEDRNLLTLIHRQIQCIGSAVALKERNLEIQKKISDSVSVWIKFETSVLSLKFLTKLPLSF